MAQARHSFGSSSPAGKVVKITKSDTADLPDGPCRSLLAGTAGTATVVTGDGTVCTNIPLQQGYNPISCMAVRSGGTADDIWALY